jgi:hypothetical protein
MKITIKNCIKRLEKEKKFLDELQELDENCSSAIEDIECAVDKLSELV